MIYFITFKEGGRFIKVIRPCIKPKALVKKLSKAGKFIAVFKNGMTHDGFLPRFRTNWRHIVGGGRKGGKEYYKRLSLVDLPTEVII
jgi:hypothetical protein